MLKSNIMITGVFSKESVPKSVSEKKKGLHFSGRKTTLKKKTDSVPETV
jgi:hypothetical protein